MRDIIFIYSFVFEIYLISANLTSTTISYGETENITCKNIKNMYIILLSSLIFFSSHGSNIIFGNHGHIQFD